MGRKEIPKYELGWEKSVAAGSVPAIGKFSVAMQKPLNPDGSLRIEIENVRCDLSHKVGTKNAYEKHTS